MKTDRPIVSLGDLVADLIIAIPTLPVQADQHQLAQEFRLEPGGGANVLIAGARLGYPMAAMGVLGDDDWGRRVAASIEAEGVDLARVRREGTTTLVAALVDDAGRHVFLGKYGSGSTIDLDPVDETLLSRAGAVYAAGYTLAEERLADLALEALAVAKNNGVPVYFDPGPQMGQMAAARRERLLSLIDIVLATEAELPLLAAEPVIPTLLEQGLDAIVVKRGAAGCAIYQAGEADPLEAPGYPVPVVDTAAAGDSFNAAFMAAGLWGWSLPERAALANAVGAAKVQKLGGGRNLPTLAEVRAVIREFAPELPPLPIK